MDSTKIGFCYVACGALIGGTVMAGALSYGWRTAVEEPEFGSMIAFTVAIVGIVVGITLLIGFTFAGFIHGCVKAARSRE